MGFPESIDTILNWTELALEFSNFQRAVDNKKGMEGAGGKVVKSAPAIRKRFAGYGTVKCEDRDYTMFYF